MLIEQLIDLSKVRTESLKFRTDLQDRVMGGWSIDDSLQRQIAKKIFKSKIEACPLNSGLYLEFTHRISLATDLAASFG